MKYLLSFTLVIILLVSCSRENETTDASADLSMQIALEENSNIGSYQAVLSTTDSQTRATISIDIPNGNDASLKSKAYPNATVTFENGKHLFLTAKEIQFSKTDTQVTFSKDNLSFDFYVNAEGKNEAITNVTLNNKIAEVLVAKSTSSAPVTPLIGTYVCTDCGTHPTLDSGVLQTFNNLVITPADGSSATLMTQVMLGGNPYTGNGTQNNCLANGTLTTCDINGTVSTPFMPVNFTGSHIFNNEDTASGNDCSQVDGTWSWQTINYGLLTGTFESAPTCITPVSTILLDYNFDGYTGAGFSPTPGAGQLDSNVIIANGFSGSLTYGGVSPTSGDYARGTSDGGTSTGGLYSFEVMPGASTFGIHPGGSDFTPGTVDIRILNNTGNTLSSFDISYLLFVNNDQARGNSLNFSYSTDNVTFTDVTSLDFTSTEAADNLGFVSNNRMASINATVADTGYLYIRFTGNDETGGGSRDEFAIDDILVVGNE